MENPENRDALFTDLDLFLREPDREDPNLPETRPEQREPEEDLDSQILAGLVSF